jgi:hypothetical protein
MPGRKLSHPLSLSLSKQFVSVFQHTKNRTIFFNVNRDLQGNKSVKKELAFVR